MLTKLISTFVKYIYEKHVFCNVPKRLLLTKRNIKKTSRQVQANTGVQMWSHLSLPIPPIKSSRIWVLDKIMSGLETIKYCSDCL